MSRSRTPGHLLDLLPAGVAKARAPEAEDQRGGMAVYRSNASSGVTRRSTRAIQQKVVQLCPVQGEPALNDDVAPRSNSMRAALLMNSPYPGCSGQRGPACRPAEWRCSVRRWSSSPSAGRAGPVAQSARQSHTSARREPAPMLQTCAWARHPHPFPTEGWISTSPRIFRSSIAWSRIDWPCVSTRCQHQGSRVTLTCS